MEITERRQGAVMVLRPEGPLTDADADQFKVRAVDVAAS